MNRALWVGRVPALAATFFLPARLPAIARVAMMRHEPHKEHHEADARRSGRGCSQLKPAKAEPLLPPAEE